jgi:GNAT superfamily N-acetyltransferase
MNIEICRYAEKYSRAFADLNYEWLEKAYTVEDHDRELLGDPASHIIDPGGQIFFALADGQPIATVALVNINEEDFELAKMAVAPDSRGQGVSNKLMAACIEYSKAAGKRRIILESNTKQVAAIKLYRKFGFVETPLNPNSPFVRVNIRMELILVGGSRTDD